MIPNSQESTADWLRLLHTLGPLHQTKDTNGMGVQVNKTHAQQSCGHGFTWRESYHASAYFIDKQICTLGASPRERKTASQHTFLSNNRRQI